MSKILITGSAGFIGYHLAFYLAEQQGTEVTLVDNLSRGCMDSDFQKLLKKDNVYFQQMDLSDENALSVLDIDYDYIYHLAAIIGVKNVMRVPDKVLKVNSRSTLNVLDFALKNNNLKKLLFSSTSEAYAGTLKHFEMEIPTPETVPLTVEEVHSPRSTYALSKIFGESACLMYALQHSLPVTIVRYHNVYGPRMGFAHVVPEMFVRMNQEKVVEVYSPDHTRAFCYIDDAVRFTEAVTVSDKTGSEIINVGNGSEEIKMIELAKIIAETMGLADNISAGKITVGSPERRCPDTHKLKKFTGLTPIVSLKEGVGLTYEWYQKAIEQNVEHADRQVVGV